MGRVAQLLTKLRVFHQLDYAPGAGFRRVHQIPADFVFDLGSDAANVAANDRLPLPHGFGDGQPKPFPGGLLQHHLGSDLKRIHHLVYGTRQVHWIKVKVDIRVSTGVTFHCVEDIEGFRVIDGLAEAQHGQLQAWNFLSSQAVGVHDADGVLPKVKPRHLGDQWAVRVDAHSGHHRGGVPVAHPRVFHADGVDRRRGNVHPSVFQSRGHVVVEREEQVVVVPGEWEQGVYGRFAGRG